MYNIANVNKWVHQAISFTKRILVQMLIGHIHAIFDQNNKHENCKSKRLLLWHIQHTNFQYWICIEAHIYCIYHKMYKPQITNTEWFGQVVVSLVCGAGLLQCKETLWRIIISYTMTCNIQWSLYLCCWHYCRLDHPWRYMDPVPELPLGVAAHHLQWHRRLNCLSGHWNKQMHCACHLYNILALTKTTLEYNSTVMILFFFQPNFLWMFPKAVLTKATFQNLI